MLLQKVSERMKGDRDLCMAAVARMEGIMGDRELYTAAVAQDWTLSSSSARRCRGGRDLCTAAVAQDWEALEFVS